LEKLPPFDPLENRYLPRPVVEREVLDDSVGVRQRVMELIEQEEPGFDGGALFGQPFEAQFDSSM
jgi:hypothetical protein